MLCKLGSYDLALHALGKAVDGGYTVTEPLLHDPWLEPLRDNPRFTEILRSARPAVTRRWPCSAPRAASGCLAALCGLTSTPG